MHQRQLVKLKGIWGKQALVRLVERVFEEEGVEGAWLVTPVPLVEGAPMRFWNEDDMKPVQPTQKVQAAVG